MARVLRGRIAAKGRQLCGSIHGGAARRAAQTFLSAEAEYIPHLAGMIPASASRIRLARRDRGNLPATSAARSSRAWSPASRCHDRSHPGVFKKMPHTSYVKNWLAAKSRAFSKFEIGPY
jgi:hypothetical protein